MGTTDEIRKQIKLQVLVCTYGNAGLERFLATDPPRLASVEYVVSMQLPENENEPAQLTPREDIEVYPIRQKGLALNRNHAMSLASAPLCLHADDDVCLRPEALTELIDTFEKHPECDVLCCRYTCRGDFMKPYAETLMPKRKAPRGWYANSFELAFRRVSAAGEVSFNVNFGVNAPLFRAGEEDVWLYDCERAGAGVWLAPITLGAHDHDSTAERSAAEPWFVMTQGAVHSHLHTWSWPLRTLLHAMRQRRMGLLRYWLLTLKGGRQARRLSVFDEV